MKNLSVNEMENVNGGGLNRQQSACLGDMAGWGGIGGVFGGVGGALIGIACAGLFSANCN